MINNDERVEANTRYYPVKHKMKVPFYSNLEVDESFSENTKKIVAFDQKLDNIFLSEEDKTELILDTFTTNIYWSTKVEGNPLTEKEVREIIQATLSHEDYKVTGSPYQDIINHVLALMIYDEMPLHIDQASIASIHTVLLMSTRSNTPLGVYRRKEASILGAKGEQLFIPCPAEYIDIEMNSLLDWLYKKAPVYYPIVAGTLFFHEFESIHPFEDGNGRLGRFLFQRYMVDNGLKKLNRTKVDYHILKNPNRYFELLAYTDEALDYGPFVNHVTRAVLQSYEEVVTKYSDRNLLNSNMDENTKRIMIMAKNKRDWFDLKEAGQWAAGIKEQSVRQRLRELIDLGILETSGKTKKLRYRFMVPFSSFKELINVDDIYEYEF